MKRLWKEKKKIPRRRHSHRRHRRRRLINFPIQGGPIKPHDLALCKNRIPFFFVYYRRSLARTCVLVYTQKEESLFKKTDRPTAYCLTTRLKKKKKKNMTKRFFSFIFFLLFSSFCLFGDDLKIKQTNFLSLGEQERLSPLISFYVVSRFA